MASIGGDQDRTRFPFTDRQPPYKKGGAPKRGRKFEMAKAGQMVRAANQATQEITITRNGKTYFGYYKVSEGTVIVAAALGEKAAKLGTEIPEHLARQLLEQLVDEGKA